MVGNKWGFYFLAVVFALVLVACKPYDKPEFVEIGSNETAFVVPMTGKTSMCSRKGFSCSSDSISTSRPPRSSSLN